MNNSVDPRLEPWSNKLLRLLFKSNTAESMSKQEFDEATPLVKAHHRKLWLVCGTFGALGTAGVFLFAIQSYTNWAGPVVDPVVNERPHWAWLMPSAFAVFTLIGAAECLYCAKINPKFGDLLHRYLSTQNRWNARKTAWFGVILGVVVTFVLSIVLILSGRVIDNNGLQYASGLSLARKSYSDVAKVGYYDAFNAPIGKRDVKNVAITFKDGDQLTFIAEKRMTTTKLDAIATYVSERAGMTIEHGSIRPDD